MPALNQSSMNCQFFLNNEPEVGSSVKMEVTLPPEIGGADGLKVLCRAKVIGIEKARENGRTGVSCTVEDFQLLSASALAKPTE